MFFIQLITKNRSNVLVNGIRWKSTTRIIDKILIANRGEIACRIAKTAKKLGIRTVAVYSDVDRNSLHVLAADEAFRIGPAAASQSYLKGDKLIEIAKHTNAQAIHPGYGFLSENVEFAEKCQKENVIFIGPPASAIRDMGIKSTSKAIMTAAGVPIIQGYHGEDQTNATLKNEAKKIGFPVMIKAVRGGGGKGMRIAYSESEFEGALESARTESQKSFGDSVVLLEKFVTEPRHVEVQIFADKYGNCVHLYERDCSVQRRHQKIIEEAPAPGLSEKLRNELGLAAVRAAKAVGYVGAGTVEFILDKNTHQFHFMEMNTRLQVEHPITEMITGTDLVEWQIKIAAGDKIPLNQEEIPLNGHAFEARIYAEDPRSGFLPGAGKLLYLKTPQSNDDTRIETGVKQGDEVSVHYDPMIAKLVVWGKQRNEALSKLKSKLRDYNIAGLETNVNFLLDLAAHPEFISGNVHTNFIENHMENLFKKIEPTNNHIYAAAFATILLNKFGINYKKNDFNPFYVESNFRVNYDHEEEIKFKYGEKDFIIKVKFNEKNFYQMSLNDGKNWVEIEGSIKNENNKFILNAIINGDLYKCNIYKNEEILAIFDERGKTEFSLIKPSFNMENDDKFSELNSNNAIAPMPGILDKLLVKSGDYVKKGDSLFVLIAMKMEYVVKATKDAKISKIGFSVGDSVPKDAIIVQFSNE